MGGNEDRRWPSSPNPQALTGGEEPSPRGVILQDLSPTHGVSCIGVAIGPRSRRASRLASSLQQIEATHVPVELTAWSKIAMNVGGAAS